MQACDKHGRIQPAVVNVDHLKSPKAKPEPAIATAQWADDDTVEDD